MVTLATEHRADIQALRDDLSRCIEALTGIWTGDENEDVARETLRKLWTRVACPFCEGEGGVTCGAVNCHGGTHRDGEWLCLACKGSGQVACVECGGEGAV